ncbi:unnamed protein product [Closterium sp. NIES-54]
MLGAADRDETTDSCLASSARPAAWTHRQDCLLFTTYYPARLGLLVLFLQWILLDNAISISRFDTTAPLVQFHAIPRSLRQKVGFDQQTPDATQADRLLRRSSKPPSLDAREAASNETITWVDEYVNIGEKTGENPQVNRENEPEYFRFIEDDLRPWRERGGIPQEALANARVVGASFRVLIVNGQLFVEHYAECYQTRALFSIWGILQLLRSYPPCPASSPHAADPSNSTRTAKYSAAMTDVTGNVSWCVPDVDLMFECNDFPLVERAVHAAAAHPPPLLLKYCSTARHMDVVWPDWSFWGWPEVRIREWGTARKLIREGTGSTPWKNRIPRAHWKGATWVAPDLRGPLVNCSRQEGREGGEDSNEGAGGSGKEGDVVGEDEKGGNEGKEAERDWGVDAKGQGNEGEEAERDWGVDAKGQGNEGEEAERDWGVDAWDTNWVHEIAEETTRLENQCTHRYKVYVEGTSWSCSLKYILACASTPIFIKTQYYDFFSRGLHNGIHFIEAPLPNESPMCPNLKRIVDWGNEHPQEAKAIAAAASDFVQDKLSMKNVYKYMLIFLNQYASLQLFVPSQLPQAKKVAGENGQAAATMAEQQLAEFVEKMRKLHEELEEVTDKASEEVLEVERSFVSQRRRPLYEKRKAVLDKIPHFWQNVVRYALAMSHYSHLPLRFRFPFRRNDNVSFFFSPVPYPHSLLPSPPSPVPLCNCGAIRHSTVEQDVKVLKHLTSLDVEESKQEGDIGYTITMVRRVTMLLCGNVVTEMWLPDWLEHESSQNLLTGTHPSLFPIIPPLPLPSSPPGVQSEPVFQQRGADKGTGEAAQCSRTKHWPYTTSPRPLPFPLSPHQAFSSNPFFSNETLTRSLVMQDELTLRVTGTRINWKEGQVGWPMGW